MVVWTMRLTIIYLVTGRRKIAPVLYEYLKFYQLALARFT